MNETTLETLRAERVRAAGALHEANERLATYEALQLLQRRLSVGGEQSVEPAAQADGGMSAETRIAMVREVFALLRCLPADRLESVLDAAIELTELPNRAALVLRVRELNGKNVDLASTLAAGAMARANSRRAATDGTQSPTAPQQRQDAP